MPLGITGTIGVEILHQGLEKHMKPISQQQISTARHLGEIQDFEIQRVTSHIRGIRTVICILAESDRPQGQMQLIHELKEKGARVVVILLGYPKNLPYLAEADAIVLAYCDSSKYGETLASMADVLVGEGPVGFINVKEGITVSAGESRTYDALDFVRLPAGRLPVTLSSRYSVGLATSFDPQFTIKKVQWEFGDGKKSKDSRTVHAFTTPGNYDVALSVTNRKGDTEIFRFPIVVNAVQ